jgi:hypothetical protein
MHVMMQLFFVFWVEYRHHNNLKHSKSKEKRTFNYGRESFQPIQIKQGRSAEEK